MWHKHCSFEMPDCKQVFGRVFQFGDFFWGEGGEGGIFFCGWGLLGFFWLGLGAWVLQFLLLFLCLICKPFVWFEGWDLNLAMALHNLCTNREIKILVFVPQCSSCLLQTAYRKISAEFVNQQISSLQLRKGLGLDSSKMKLLTVMGIGFWEEGRWQRWRTQHERVAGELAEQIF